jgi:uncharacterized protein YecE (DUF72 family)
MLRSSDDPLGSVWVYFNNDAEANAVYNAEELLAQLAKI